MTTDLATRLVEEWAADRYTQPTAAERDLVRWILERMPPSELQGPLAALQSWTGAPR